MIRDIINQNEEAQPTDRTLGLLHRDFPQCFNAEGKFDIAAFRELLTDKVDLIKEGSGFNFLGKNYASLLASMDTTTVLVPDLEHNSKPENINSQNVYISGDNLDALKHLVKSYAGKHMDLPAVRSTVHCTLKIFHLTCSILPSHNIRTIFLIHSILLICCFV